MIVIGISHFLVLYYFLDLFVQTPFREWSYHVSTVHAIVVTLVSVISFFQPLPLWIAGFMLAYFATDLTCHYFKRHLKPSSFYHHVAGLVLLLGFAWRQDPIEVAALPKFTIIEASTPLANRLWFKKKAGQDYWKEGIQFMAVFFVTRIVWFPIAIATTAPSNIILWGLYVLQWWWFSQMIYQVYRSHTRFSEKEKRRIPE